MIIVIASQHGAGKSTVTELLSQHFSWLRTLDMGEKFRALAKDKGLSIEEFTRLLTEKPEESDRIDREMDDWQKKEIAKGDIIVNSSVGAMLTEDADLKVLLTCPLNIRAKRVFEGKSRLGDSSFTSVAEVENDLVERDRNDQERYKRLYNFDMFDTDNYDVVIDTGEMTKKEAVQKVMDELKRRNPNAF
ncbi:cytidylate kinase family protein [archaeon]